MSWRNTGEINEWKNSRNREGAGQLERSLGTARLTKVVRLVRSAEYVKNKWRDKLQK